MLAVSNLHSTAIKLSEESQAQNIVWVSNCYTSHLCHRAPSGRTWIPWNCTQIDIWSVCSRMCAFGRSCVALDWHKLKWLSITILKIASGVALTLYQVCIFLTSVLWACFYFHSLGAGVSLVQVIYITDHNRTRSKFRRWQMTGVGWDKLAKNTHFFSNLGMQWLSTWDSVESGQSWSEKC